MPASMAALRTEVPFGTDSVRPSIVRVTRSISPKFYPTRTRRRTEDAPAFALRRGLRLSASERSPPLEMRHRGVVNIGLDRPQCALQWEPGLGDGVGDRHHK